MEQKTLVVKIDPYDQETSLILMNLQNESEVKSYFGCLTKNLKYERLNNYLVITDKQAGLRSPGSSEWFKLFSKRFANKALVVFDKTFDVTKAQLIEITQNTNFKIKQPSLVVVHHE